MAGNLLDYFKGKDGNLDTGQVSKGVLGVAAAAGAVVYAQTGHVWSAIKWVLGGGMIAAALHLWKETKARVDAPDDVVSNPPRPKKKFISSTSDSEDSPASASLLGGISPSVPPQGSPGEQKVRD